MAVVRLSLDGQLGKGRSLQFFGRVCHLPPSLFLNRIVGAGEVKKWNVDKEQKSLAIGVKHETGQHTA
ncbi:hypothetical protein HNY73_004471 [Argiope bruennichi]|uniref:Uncharacterized protein n=1 Tax=Argiope bruennichi TaxID=94029 RepID=A0A8T0FW00_ARGBR|nr:hypothetical protein HNY73_004471 [Argiope bruennichi]